MNKIDVPHLIWLVPIFMLLLAATISLPETYYQLLRLDIFVFVLYLLWQQYSIEPKAKFWVIILTLIIVVFNPIYVFPFTKAIWISVDVAAVIMLFIHLLLKSKRHICKLKSLW